MQQLTNWCKVNNKSQNVDKTNDMIIDFRKARSNYSSLNIDKWSVEIVQSSTCLGVYLAANLDWFLNTSCIVK